MLRETGGRLREGVSWGLFGVVQSSGKPLVTYAYALTSWRYWLEPSEAPTECRVPRRATHGVQPSS